jgi:hypothetical protein
MARGRTVRIPPPTVTVVDILEYALEAIEEHGWRQGGRPVEPGDDTRREWEKDVVPSGLSLHDAIGYSCLVLSGETGRTATPARSPSASKDFPTQNRVTGTMRQKATAALGKVLPASETDITFNDKADSVDAVTDVLRAAIKEASK